MWESAGLFPVFLTTLELASWKTNSPTGTKVSLISLRLLKFKAAQSKWIINKMMYYFVKWYISGSLFKSFLLSFISRETSYTYLIFCLKKKLHTQIQKLLSSKNFMFLAKYFKKWRIVKFFECLNKKKEKNNSDSLEKTKFFSMKRLYFFLSIFPYFCNILK